MGCVASCVVFFWVFYVGGGGAFCLLCFLKVFNGVEVVNMLALTFCFRLCFMVVSCGFL